MLALSASIKLFQLFLEKNLKFESKYGTMLCSNNSELDST